MTEDNLIEPSVQGPLEKRIDYRPFMIIGLILLGIVGVIVYMSATAACVYTETVDLGIFGKETFRILGHQTNWERMMRGPCHVP